MNWRETWKADWFSTRDLLLRSAVILLGFAVAHLAGLREYTSIVNGTMGSVTVGWHLSVFLGLIYLVLYFATVVLVPIIWIAALLLKVQETLGRHRTTRTGKEYGVDRAV